MSPKTEEKICKFLLWGVAFIAFFILVVITANIMGQGLSHIDLELLLENPRRGGSEGGIFSTIVFTGYLIAIALLIATPIGVGAAIFLTEYQRQGKLLQIIRFATESLAGIPSIVFGLFGFAFFVVFLRMGWSLLSGGLTVSLMILPIIIRSSEEAINAVPDSFREGSFALGATKWQTIVRVVIPTALPSIITGIILSMGRVVGETAAVMVTAGTALGIPGDLLESGRSMSVHLYILAVEAISMERAYATATILIITVILINLAVNFLIARQRAKLDY